MLHDFVWLEKSAGLHGLSGGSTVCGFYVAASNPRNFGLFFEARSVKKLPLDALVRWWSRSCRFKPVGEWSNQRGLLNWRISVSADPVS